MPGTNGLVCDRDRDPGGEFSSHLEQLALQGEAEPPFQTRILRGIPLTPPGDLGVGVDRAGEQADRFGDQRRDVFVLGGLSARHDVERPPDTHLRELGECFDAAAGVAAGDDERPVGTWVLEREPALVRQQRSDGRALLALDQLEEVVGFAWIERDHVCTDSSVAERAGRLETITRPGTGGGLQWMRRDTSDTCHCYGLSRVYSRIHNQVPATWFAATAGIRLLASPERRPLHQGPSPLFRVVRTVPLDACRAGGSDEAAFGVAQLSLGLVDGGHEVVSGGPDERRGQIGHP